MDIDKQKLMAARLLLGDDLAKELVNDQWNAVNELSDPYEVRGNTSRYGMAAARLAAKVLGAVSDGLMEPALDLSKRKEAAYRNLAKEEQQAWLRGGPEPDSYAAETCSDFAGPTLPEIITALERDLADKTALLEGRFSDARLVEFKGSEITAHGAIVPVIVETLAQTLGHREAGLDVANYVEISVHHPELGELTVNVQRKSGKTPHELRREAEKQLEKVLSER